MKRENKIILTLIVILMLLLGFLFYQNGKTKEALGITNALSDELEVARNEKGQETAKISVIQAENKKQLLAIKSKDSSIIRLQATVKDYKGKLNTAIVLSNTTNIKGSSQTTVLRDTVTISGEQQIAQFYETRWSNKWEDGYILAKPDSIHRDIKIKNDFQITLGAVSNGWFKPKDYEVKILNLNPNTATKELRSYQVKEQPKRISLGVQVGYGFGLLDFKAQPYVGLGLQYNLVGIK